MPRLLSTFILFFTLLAYASRLGAQSTFGSIVGEVRDPSGAVVAAAAINVTEIDANTVRSVSSDKEGLYQILNLKPGRYELTAEKSGFATTKAGDVLLDARQTLRVNLKLEIAPVAQTVVVNNISPQHQHRKPGYLRFNELSADHPIATELPGSHDQPLDCDHDYSRRAARRLR